jgi:hypothetical protein
VADHYQVQGKGAGGSMEAAAGRRVHGQHQAGRFLGRLPCLCTYTQTHLEADVLPLPIAVQPQHEVCAGARLGLEVLADAGARIGLPPHGGGIESTQAAHTSTHGGHRNFSWAAWSNHTQGGSSRDTVPHSSAGSRSQSWKASSKSVLYTCPITDVTL